MLVIFLLFSSYKSNNPLVSALCVVMSLVVVCPMVVSVVHQWFIYTTVMLFLSGILVIVVYFASLSTFSYKVVVGVNFLAIMAMIFYPHMFTYFSNFNIGVMFTPMNLMLLLFILSSLLVLMNFTSYMVSRGGAMRRF